jgi:hypothetical protein
MGVIAVRLNSLGHEIEIPIQYGSGPCPNHNAENLLPQCRP